MRSCLIVSYISYPFGGGEDFLFQTMKWLAARGVRIAWLSFASKDREPFREIGISRSTYGWIIQVPGGLSVDTLSPWLRLFSPDFVNTQGLRMADIVGACEPLRIPVIAGYHFWVDLVDLNPATFNRNILANASGHRISPAFRKVQEKVSVIPYVCSDFMAEVLGKIEPVDVPVIYAACNEDKSKVLTLDPWSSKYVTQVNIHHLKGGEILKHAVEQLPEIPFYVIQTEPKSEGLDADIRRALGAGAENIYREFTPDMRSVYAVTKILLVPSLVDETFCRVVNEAMMNGIVVVTTGKGNISKLIGDAGIIMPEEKTLWPRVIQELYSDRAVYATLSDRARERYKLFSEEKARNQFFGLSARLSGVSKVRNLMILCPFCDQGLGIQSRIYLSVLRQSPLRTFVFSYSPYTGYARDRQIDRSEWDFPDVHYSDRTREQITDDEIVQFVRANNIGKCLIPETCWSRIFELGQLLKSLGVETYAVPNIEIVRRDELHKHSVFDNILCNNWLCHNEFRTRGFSNAQYLGFSIKPDPTPRPPRGNGPIKFVCVGGMNAYTRKQVHKVCDAFVLAKKTCPNIQLTVTVQGNHSDKLAPYEGVPFITIVREHLTHAAVMSLLREADVCIQVSSHEGLGMGFFEALSVGTAVITLDTPPHNEIITSAGWTIPCDYVEMPDNPQSLIKAARFNVRNLAEGIVRVAGSREFPTPNTLEDYRSFEKRLSMLLLQ
jgi:glycosyltransferase involved in cell wall biosynthesis